jgi:hypothetical protein
MTEREQALEDIARGMELFWRGTNTLDRLLLEASRATSLGLTGKPPVPKPSEGR